MSLHTDPDERTGLFAEGFEVYVAREHWAPILIQALLYGTTLVVVALLLGLPVLNALALVHVVASVSGFFGGLLAMRLEEMEPGTASVVIARRSLAALLVSGAALLLVPFAQ
ncbi:hypothetical protein A6A40_17015 (plasmid) [Azospirillum humicireducens]|uniref:Uncharacterized protein n=1 Tax=Azospirillum humicireducens TaxID=1226968 RepID=A0A2R4VQM6_9PROT|nr:hypothetical protein [Azospirillum humicireducens]AWB06754.1 hypothetical protein A6A40_17015 [Azospirillum humicireducens]